MLLIELKTKFLVFRIIDKKPLYIEHLDPYHRTSHTASVKHMFFNCYILYYYHYYPIWNSRSFFPSLLPSFLSSFSPFQQTNIQVLLLIKHNSVWWDNSPRVTLTWNAIPFPGPRTSKIPKNITFYCCISCLSPKTKLTLYIAIPNSYHPYICKVNNWVKLGTKLQAF